MQRSHAIIYTSEHAPKPKEHETKLLRPIYVKPATPREKLDRAARLNYAKLYTIEHNVKVWFIGKVASKFEKQLIDDYNKINKPLSDPRAARNSSTPSTASKDTTMPHQIPPSTSQPTNNAAHGAYTIDSNAYPSNSNSQTSTYDQEWQSKNESSHGASSSSYVVHQPEIATTYPSYSAPSAGAPAYQSSGGSNQYQTSPSPNYASASNYPHMNPRPHVSAAHFYQQQTYERDETLYDED